MIASKYNILFICTGNICRSPMAEYLLQDMAYKNNVNISVRSAGTGAVVGAPVHAYIKLLLEKDGIDCNKHKARQISLKIIAESDLILVMEDYHKYTVNHLFPCSCGKTFLLSEYLSFGGIPDPINKQFEEFLIIQNMIKKGLQSWFGKILAV